MKDCPIMSLNYKGEKFIMKISYHIEILSKKWHKMSFKLYLTLKMLTFLLSVKLLPS